MKKFALVARPVEKLARLPIWGMAGSNDGGSATGRSNMVERLKAAGNVPLCSFNLSATISIFRDDEPTGQARSTPAWLRMMALVRQ